MYFTICVYCKHMREAKRGLSCAAFPIKIPTAMIQGEPHIFPIEGQGNEIVFTPAPGLSESDADAIFESSGIDIKPRIIDPEEIAGTVFRSRIGTPIPDAVIVSGVDGYENDEFIKQFTLISDCPTLRRGWKLKYQDDEDSPEIMRYLQEKIEEIAREMRSEGWEVELATDGEGRPEAHLRHLNTLKEVERLANKEMSKSIDTTKNTLKPSEKNPLVNRWQKIQGNGNLPSKNEVMVIDPEDKNVVRKIPVEFNHNYDGPDMQWTETYTGTKTIKKGGEWATHTSDVEINSFHPKKICAHPYSHSSAFDTEKERKNIENKESFENAKTGVTTLYHYAIFLPEGTEVETYSDDEYRFEINQDNNIYFVGKTEDKMIPTNDPRRMKTVLMNYTHDVSKEPRILAEIMHKNQLYGNGQSYFKAHIAPVAEIAYSLASEVNPALRDTAKQVAYLHDIIEDTPTTKEELAERYGQDIANSVELLSKSPEQIEDNYLSLISGDEIASIVKAADRIQNILGLNEMTDGERKAYLIDKYKRQTEYFEKYNIFPEKIREAINQIK